MTPKKPKKPTAAELLPQLIAQVAELRGRIERLESRGPQTITVYQEPDPKPPVAWWQWFGG